MIEMIYLIKVNAIFTCHPIGFTFCEHRVKVHEMRHLIARGFCLTMPTGKQTAGDLTQPIISSKWMFLWL